MRIILSVLIIMPWMGGQALSQERQLRAVQVERATIAAERERDTLITELSEQEQAAEQRGAASRKRNALSRLPSNFSPYTDRIENTPDISQHIRFNELPDDVVEALGLCDAGGGPNMAAAACPSGARVMPLNRCGPSSLANNLIWLDRTHFPNISPIENRDAAAYDLIPREIDGYYGYDEMVNDAAAFLKKRNVTPKSYKVIGSVDRSDLTYTTGDVPFSFEWRQPTLKDIQDALRRKAIVTTIWGYYEPQTKPWAKQGVSPSTTFAAPQTKTPSIAAPPPANPWHVAAWERTNGHWVAPVGYGRDEEGKIDPTALIFHNSAGPGNRMRAQQHLYFSTLTNIPNKPYLVKRVSRDNDADTELCPQWDGYRVECRSKANGHLISGGAPAPEDTRVMLIEGVVIIDF